MATAKFLFKTTYLRLPPTTPTQRSFFWRASKAHVVHPDKVIKKWDIALPPNVQPPPYHSTGRPPPSPTHPEVKGEKSIQRMKESCKLARKILTAAGKIVAPGVTTEEIDALVREMAFSEGAYPSPLNYKGFPKSVCTSVNNVVCHGIPDLRPLEEGDIVNIDVTVFIGGHHGDCSKTFLVGEVDLEGQTLVEIGKGALAAGLEACGPGRPYAGIGEAIQEYCKKEESGRFKPVPAFTGHGIGTYFHGPPDIFCCRNGYPGRMEPGVTFTVEPAISEGSPQIKVLKDGWTAVSRDDSRSAQFEHTVLVTSEGVEVLTTESEGEAT